MPPKPKFTREEIIDAALKIVAEKGESALTAKELGDALGSSARPIFTVFNGMNEVRDEVIKAAMRRFECFANQKVQKVPLFKQVGMQMVMFGCKEPKLYQLLFMRENKNAGNFDDVFITLGTTAEVCIDLIKKEYDLSETLAKKLFENVWIYTFGIGALCATGFCNFSEEKLGEMLSTEFNAIMLLIKSEKERSKGE